MISFAYPWMFLLLPCPWILRVLLPPMRRQIVSVRVPFGSRVVESRKGGGGVPNRHHFRWLVPALIWLMCLVALARPQKIEPPVTKDLPTRDLLLLVDLSGSMQHEDFTDRQGNTVDRLTAVKEVVGDFLIRRKGDRVGLVVFGDAPYLQAPFSTDLDLSRQLLEQCAVGMAGPRTAFGDAIGLGVNLFANSDSPAKTIIALTDGNDTKSQVPPVEASRVASQRGIRIHTVAVGDPTTVGEEKLDVELLKEVASTADGSYFYAANRDELEGIYEQLDKLETRQFKTISHRPRHDLYKWMLLLALIISVTEKAWVAISRTRACAAVAVPDRVRVNAATGKLEVTP
ncbi:VWA domain-containing protein [Rubripirellula sp.]|nr:VWA domain-containing protein [Rubripirellula sp.]